MVVIDGDSVWIMSNRTYKIWVTWLLRSEGRSSIPEDMPNISFTLTANHDLK